MNKITGFAAGYQQIWKVYCDKIVGGRWKNLIAFCVLRSEHYKIIQVLIKSSNTGYCQQNNGINISGKYTECKNNCIYLMWVSFFKHK